MGQPQAGQPQVTPHGRYGPETAMTGGEALVRALAVHGARTAFGIPGTHNLEIYRHLRPYGIGHVTPRHEQGAGYAADAYARVTGRPGIAVTTTGPALLNIAAAAGQAYSALREALTQPHPTAAHGDGAGTGPAPVASEGHCAVPGADGGVGAFGAGGAATACDNGLTAAPRTQESAGRCAAPAARTVVLPLGARDADTSGSALHGPAARAVSVLRRGRDAETAVRDARWVPYLRAIRGVLDEDAVITSDSAQCCYYGALPHLAVGPRGRYLHPTGFGTLGYALPAAIGAKSAYPERQVVALSGDGGLQFTVQELATAAQLGLPLPVVVFDNGGYGEIRDEMNARGDTPTAVDLARIDLPALCRAYGGRGAHAASPGALADALARALNTPGPTVITVPEETTA